MRVKVKENIDQYEIAKLKKGDFAAFDLLFEKYSHRIYYFAYGYLKSKEEAEEVVQDVFLKIWEKRQSLDETLSFKSYLFTITFNAIKKVILHAAKRETAFQSLKAELGEIQYDQEDAIQTQEFQKTIIALIDRLPDRRKEIFLMSRIEEKSNQVIATELSVSVKTVENQISEAKSYLKESLKAYFSLWLFFALFY